MGKYSGVIFDMDGLIFDTEIVYLETNVRLAPKYGLVGLDHDYMMTCIGISDKEVYEKYRNDFPNVSKENMDAFISAGHQEVRAFFESGQTQLKPGARELLAVLKKENIPCVVASSNLREFIELLLEKAGIQDYFAGIVSANEVKQAKPDPEIVEKAVALLQLKPSECVMLEDSLNGVRAAYSASVPVIVVPDLLSPDFEMKDKASHIVPSLFEVTELIL